jgi:hypothetical protein
MEPLRGGQPAGSESALQTRWSRAPTPPDESKLPPTSEVTQVVATPTHFQLHSTPSRVHLVFLCWTGKPEFTYPLQKQERCRVLQALCCSRTSVAHTRFQPFRTWPTAPPLPLPLLTFATDSLPTWPLLAGPGAGSQRSAHPGLALRGPGHGGHAFSLPHLWVTVPHFPGESLYRTSPGSHNGTSPGSRHRTSPGLRYRTFLGHAAARPQPRTPGSRYRKSPG